MNRSSSEVTQLIFPGDRWKLVQWGIDTAVTNGIDLSPFGGRILVVHNYGVDHGAAHNGIIIVHQDPAVCEFGFICHEMGHGFGLPHSWSANPDMEYGDGWDVMSFATTTFLFDISFKGTKGKATVGLNARNVDALQAVPPSRVLTLSHADFSESITLDPLNQLPLGNHGFLIAKILPNATCPVRASNSIFTIEFRKKAGWDQAIPQDAVLIHEVRTNGASYLQPTIWGQFVAGQQFVMPNPRIFVRIVNIDTVSATATLRVWDMPEGSLRKEDSKPKVYLITSGQKRHITSAQVLYSLGHSWADVRSVPDGALGSIPSGPPITTITPQVGIQFKGNIPPGQTYRWFTYNWPENWHVLWSVVPTSPKPGAPQIEWDVEVERASRDYVTYWISIKNISSNTVDIEGRYAVLN
jgi:hypothetical protein